MAKCDLCGANVGFMMERCSSCCQAEADRVAKALTEAERDANAEGVKKRYRMALIKCPDCGKKISDAAAICINCGRLMENIPESRESFPPLTTRQKNTILKAFSWKSLLIAFFLSFIITVIAAAVNPGYRVKGVHWTLVWMVLAVEGYKYWGWKSLIPYPSYLLFISLISILIISIGGDVSDSRIITAALNISFVTIFAFIFYRRIKKEEYLSSRKPIPIKYDR